MRRSHGPRDLRLRRAAAVCAALLYGCTPPIPAGKFQVLKDGSTAALVTAGRAYDDVGTLQARKQVYRAAAERRLTRELFTPATGPLDTDIAARTRSRRAALEVLVDYFTALQALATRDFAGEVDEAAHDLAGSVEVLAARATTDSEARQISGVFATVVDVLGREIVKKKRREALRTVMGHYQSDVEKTCKFVADGNAVFAAASTVLVDDIIENADHTRPRDGAARVAFDGEVARAVREGTALRDALGAVSAAVLQLPRAHAEVRGALEDEQGIVEALGQLAAEAKRARTFYEEMNQ